MARITFHFDSENPDLQTQRIGDGEYSILSGVVIRHHVVEDCNLPCPLHGPSNHSMVLFPMVYRFDRGIVERICPHGVGHPDPDNYTLRIGMDPGIHGCDGCCVPAAPHSEVLDWGSSNEGK